MNKGKFASLIMLGAFSAGVASSSAVSAQGDSNLASVVDNKSASSQDVSVTTDFKFSDESVSVSDENNIYLKQQTDEETQDDSTDGSSNERNDAENLDKNIENKTDLPESSAKGNSKNGDYLFFDDDKKQNVKKVRMVKGLTVAGIGASAVSGATFGISKLVKSSKNDKKDEPKPEPEPDPEPKPKPTPEPEPGPKLDPKKKEEKGGFAEWYKTNLVASIPLTFLTSCIFLIIICTILKFRRKGKRENFFYFPFFGKCSMRKAKTKSKSKALLYCFWAALTLSKSRFAERESDFLEEEFKLPETNKSNSSASVITI